ncbi:MAG: flippase-like domain-containing protein [Elusimicrobia bacterium]|nr:flippase-like domain-containing protein [Elusimicrobiota bacterium]
MKKHLSVIAGIFFSVLFLYLALRGVDLRGLVSLYSGLSPATVAPLVVLCVLDLVWRGLRWKFLLRSSRDIPAWQVIKFETIGFALNNVLPMRLGELARATLVARTYGISLVTVLSTIVVERILDTMALSIVFAFSLRYAPVAPWVQRYSGLVWVLIPVLFAGLMVLCRLEAVLAWPRVRAFMARHPRVYGILEKIAAGAGSLKVPGYAVVICALSLLLWFMDAAGFAFASRALGLVPALSYGNGLFLLSATAVAVSVPSAPGYFGTYEYAVRMTMEAWGYQGSSGMALSGLVHMTTYIVFTVSGIVFLYQAGHSLKSMWHGLTGGGSSDAGKAA